VVKVDWNGQRKKLMENALYAKRIRYGVISTPGGTQELLGIEVKYLRVWLISGLYLT
jgi:hypothetical protein